MQNWIECLYRDKYKDFVSKVRGHLVTLYRLSPDLSGEDLEPIMGNPPNVPVRVFPAIIETVGFLYCAGFSISRVVWPDNMS